MIGLIKTVLGYGLLLIALWAGVTYLPRFLNTAVVPTNYDDVEGLKDTESYWLDAQVSPAAYAAGDALAFNFGTDKEQTRFAWVAATPGQQVAIVNGKLIVDGQPAGKGTKLPRPNQGPIIVPEHHLYVVSDNHRFDSLSAGPIPMAAVLGRIGALP